MQSTGFDTYMINVITSIQSGLKPMIKKKRQTFRVNCVNFYNLVCYAKERQAENGKDSKVNKKALQSFQPTFYSVRQYLIMLSLHQKTLLSTNSIRNKNLSYRIKNTECLTVKPTAWKASNLIKASVWDRIGLKLNFLGEMKINS